MRPAILGVKLWLYTGLLDLISRRADACRIRVQALGLTHVESVLAAEDAFLPGWLSLSKQAPPPAAAPSSEVGSNP